MNLPPVEANQDRRINSYFVQVLGDNKSLHPEGLKAQGKLAIFMCEFDEECIVL